VPGQSGKAEEGSVQKNGSLTERQKDVQAKDVVRDAHRKERGVEKTITRVSEHATV